MTEAEMRAAEILRVVARRQQAVMRCDATTPVEAIRAAVRAAARARRLRIRTALVDNVLVVVGADADLWSEDTATMRQKLQAPDRSNVVG